jgi:hypothetical protein
MPVDYGERGTSRHRGRAGALLGLASLLLLAASLRWAHHWGPLADALVAGFGASTLGALGSSAWSLRTSSAARGLAKLGLTLAGLSLLALAVAGIAAAAGADPAAACGGG